MADLKTDYGGQTPKHDEGDESDVEELIHNANILIASVYSDFNNSRLSFSSPEARPTTHDESPRTLRRQEIERIHRFCESIDEDLPQPPSRRRSTNTESRRSRSPNNLLQAESVRENMNTALLQNEDVNDGGNRTAIDEVDGQRTLNIAFLGADSIENEDRTSDSNNADTIDVIDLSNVPSNIEPTANFAPRRRRMSSATFANHAVPDDDDDVIIVSSNLVDIVDLCTPVRDFPTHRCRQPRRLSGAAPVLTTNRSRSPSVTMAARSVQTSTTHIPQPQQQRQLFLSKSPSSTDAAGGGAALSLSDSSLNSGSGNERPVLMCPVCMESSLKRKPTSTKCGHVFCEICINQALRLTRKCPMCNTKLTNKMLFRIYP